MPLPDTLTRPLGLVLAALLRAQLAHLAVVVAGPLALLLARLLGGMVLLPFTLTAVGDRGLDLAAGWRQLAQPGCWVALAPCDLAEQELFALPVPQSTAVPPAGGAAQQAVAPAEPYASFPESFTLRHAWFVLWLLWFLVYLAGRRPGRT